MSNTSKQGLSRKDERPYMDDFERGYVEGWNECIDSLPASPVQEPAQEVGADTMCTGSFVAIDGTVHPDSDGQFVYFLHQCDSCGLQIEAYEQELSQLNAGRHERKRPTPPAVGGDVLMFTDSEIETRYI